MKLTTAQARTLTFLNQDALCFQVNGTPAANIKVRNARPLLRAGLVATDQDPDANAAAGGWIICAITPAGKEALAA